MEMAWMTSFGINKLHKIQDFLSYAGLMRLTPVGITAATSWEQTPATVKVSSKPDLDT